MTCFTYFFETSKVFMLLKPISSFGTPCIDIVAVLILKRRKFVANLFCIRFCWWRRLESFYDSFLSYFLKESHFWSFLTRGELKNYISYNKGAQPYAHNVARAGVWSGLPSRRQLKFLIENSFLEVRDNEINNFFPHRKYLT